MKVALVYDRVNKWGGAERVLLALQKLFPNAPLYTSVYDKEKAPWANVFDIKTSFLQKIPFAATNHELFASLMPLSFESFNFDKYDLVISLSSEAAKGIVTKPGTAHICYCLTPTRYLWSGYEEYFPSDWVKLLSKPVISSLRKWDMAASKRPDTFIAISKEVQKRIRKYYQRESELVYPPATLSLAGRAGPPVSLESPKSLPRREAGKAQNAGYYLVVSRLSKFTKYKRVDIAVKAANELKIPLKIVGDGNLRKDLEKISGSTIEFLGSVRDRELVEYYKNCKALIFPGNEDLGLVMIEAQMYGKPVLAYKSGGALELVEDFKTGLFFNEQTQESLTAALKKFEKIKIDPKDCAENAGRFSFDNFKKDFLSVVNKLI